MFNLLKIVAQNISRTVQKNNQFVRKSQKLRLKLKNIKQTATQAEQVQKLIQNNSKQEVAAKIQRTANYQSQFRDFLNKFNEKHKDTINVMDLSNYAKKFEDLSTPGLKRQDIELLDQYRKRRLENSLKKEIEAPTVRQKIRAMRRFKLNIQRKKLDINSSSIIRFKRKLKNQKQIRQFISADKLNTQKREDKNQLFYQGPFKIRDRFHCFLIDRDSTTCVTTLNRVNSFRCIIYMANGNGLIGYGRGIGKDYAEALRKAISHCKKNIIAIPIDPHLGLPKLIHKNFQDYDLKLMPLNFVDPYGHPFMITLLMMTGLSHFKFKTIHTGKSKYGLINVIFKCLVQNTTPKKLAEKQGFKVYRHQWVKPYQRDEDIQFIS